MKDEILKLRSEGLSYNQICEKLHCSKSLVSYHCGEGQKEKTRKRTQKRRRETVIVQRVEQFQYNRKIKDKTEDFQRIRFSNERRLGKRILNFSWKDVIEKFGWKTKCYLTGRLIDLHEPKTYQFDHIVPHSKGGEWTLNNLGIVCKEANMAKSDMSVEQLLNLCKEILEYNGFKVSEQG